MIATIYKKLVYLLLLILLIFQGLVLASPKKIHASCWLADQSPPGQCAWCMGSDYNSSCFKPSSNCVTNTASCKTASCTEFSTECCSTPGEATCGASANPTCQSLGGGCSMTPGGFWPARTIGDDNNWCYNNGGTCTWAAGARYAANMECVWASLDSNCNSIWVHDVCESKTDSSSCAAVTSATTGGWGSCQWFTTSQCGPQYRDCMDWEGVHNLCPTGSIAACTPMINGVCGWPVCQNVCNDTITCGAEIACPGCTVSVSPSSASLIPGQSASLNASVNLYNGAVQKNILWNTNNYSVARPDNLVPNNLVAYWKMEDGNDLLGTSTGTFVNGTTTVAGIDSNARSFDGIDDYMDVTNQSPFNFGTSSHFTLAAWIKRGNTRGWETFENIFIKALPSSPYTGYYFRIGDFGRLEFILATNESNFLWKRAGVDVSDNKWHHLVVTYNGGGSAAGSVKMFVDGIERTVSDISIGAFTSITNGENLRLGYKRPGVSSDYYFRGNMDEIGVWNTDLTAQQIANLYATTGISVFANAAGSANITTTVNTTTDFVCTATTPITVTSPTCSLTASPATLSYSGSGTVNATILPAGAPIDHMTWSSSDTNIVTVVSPTAQGVLSTATTAKTTGGTVTITGNMHATPSGPSIGSCTTTITVRPPAWFQVAGGDLYGKNGVTSIVPSSCAANCYISINN